ncbi:MAG: hypothetical protein JSW47_13395 [Phycisphaerales bacterium]|nr:MAG: hypothetical protein JSW47_13395 [Phycisphaerales bacterium]
MKRKAKLYASWLFLVCILIIVGYFALCTDRNLTVYDDNFKILNCTISTGTSHIIYSGNQTVGRIRAMLRHRFGLKFISLPPVPSMIRARKSRAFILRYEGDFPFEELDGLRAVLTNDKNISKELTGINMAAKAEQTFVRCYILPALPTSYDSFRIDLRLKSADDPIASWRVGQLYRRNRGINPDR